MAASNEIRFKIGADTSALSSGFAKAQSIAAIAGAQIQKKLGLRDAVKGMFVGLGIGSVDAISNIVVSPFRRGAEAAREMADLTSGLYQTTIRLFGAIGGPQKELELKQRQLRDISVDIQMAQKLASELESNPINFISQEGRDAMRQANQEVKTLIQKQADLNAEIEITKRSRAEAAAKIIRDARVEADVAKVQLERRGKLAELQARMNGLSREAVSLHKKFGGAGPEVAGNLAQQAAIIDQIAILKSQAQQDAQQSTFNAGSAIAGAPRRLRSRGKSEAERIATRGANYIQQAEEAARKGMSPSYVAKLTSLGERDMKAAGQKMQSATALVNSDSNVKSAIINSASELKEIRKNLEIDE
jgi:hypothetical protein